MKISSIIASLTLIVGLSAQAQNNPNQNKGPGNQPQPMGQPQGNQNMGATGPAGQASGKNVGTPPMGNKGQPPMGANGQPPMGMNNQPPMGANGQPPMGANNQQPMGNQPQGNNMQPPHNEQAGGPNPKWPAKRCEKEAKRLENFAKNCVNMKQLNQRKTCFKKVEPKFPREFWETCNAQTDAVKAKVESLVAEKYPGEPTGIEEGDDRSGGPKGPDQHGQNGPPGQPNHQGANGQPANMGDSQSRMPAADCKKFGNDVKAKGTACLKLADHGVTMDCFKKVKNFVDSKKMGDSCGGDLDALKAEFEQKLTDKFPGKSVSIE